MKMMGSGKDSVAMREQRGTAGVERGPGWQRGSGAENHSEIYFEVV